MAIILRVVLKSLILILKIALELISATFPCSFNIELIILRAFLWPGLSVFLSNYIPKVDEILFVRSLDFLNHGLFIYLFIYLLVCVFKLHVEPQALLWVKSFPRTLILHQYPKPLLAQEISAQIWVYVYFHLSFHRSFWSSSGFFRLWNPNIYYFHFFVCALTSEYRRTCDHTTREFLIL